MADVTANYIGQADGKFAVNVKSAVPSGKLGDAGLIEKFDNEADAKAFVEAINNNKLAQPAQDGFVKSTAV